MKLTVSQCEAVAKEKGKLFESITYMDDDSGPSGCFQLNPNNYGKFRFNKRQTGSLCSGSNMFACYCGKVPGKSSIAVNFYINLHASINPLSNKT